MDGKLRKNCNMFLAACWFTYFISIAVKITYSAEMVVIIEFFSSTKAQVSLGLTIYYIIYAAAQAVLAAIVKKLNLRLYLTVTLSLSALLFALVVFVQVLWQLWLIMAVNGILQAGIWVGCLYLFGKYMPDEFSGNITKTMGMGMAFGTAAGYGASALFSAILSWQYTFLFFAVLTIAGLIWFLFAEKSIRKLYIEKGVATERETVPAGDEPDSPAAENLTVKGKTKNNFLFFTYLIFVMFLISAVYFALSNWLPSLFFDIYGVDSSYSMLISVLIPICMMFGPFLTSYSCARHENYFAVTMFYLLAVMICPIILIFFYDANIILALGLSLIFLVVANGLRSVFSTFLPLKLKHKINSGTSAAMINVSASAAASLMPFISGLILDNFGWQANYIVITLLCAVCVAALVPFALKRKRAIKNKKTPFAGRQQ